METYQQEMAKFPVYGSEQPESTEQELATLIPSSKRAASADQLLAACEAH